MIYLEGIIIGLISGCLSSYIVYLLTKRRETSLLKNREIKDFGQLLSRYLRILAFEIDSSMKEDGYGDIKHLKKELIDPPRLIHNQPEDYNEEVRDALKNIYSFLGELESEIDKSEKFLNTRLLKHRSKLIQNAILILRVV